MRIEKIATIKSAAVVDLPGDSNPNPKKALEITVVVEHKIYLTQQDQLDELFRHVGETPPIRTIYGSNIYALKDCAVPITLRGAVSNPDSYDEEYDFTATLNIPRKEIEFS